MPSGVCCGAAAYPGDKRGWHSRTHDCHSAVSQGLRGIADPTARLPPCHPSDHPSRTRIADASTLAFSFPLLPACLPAKSCPSFTTQSSQEVSSLTWSLGIPLWGFGLLDISVGLQRLDCPFVFLCDLRAGPGAERRQGRQEGGGIAKTSFIEVHMCFQNHPRPSGDHENWSGL